LILGKYEAKLSILGAICKGVFSKQGSGILIVMGKMGKEENEDIAKIKKQ
jgi:hypothetical protein